MKKESGSAARQSEVAGKDAGWTIAEVTGNKLEWVPRANGMAPSWGVRESQATVRFDKRRWLPVEVLDDGVRRGSATGRAGEGRKRTGRLAATACREQEAVTEIEGATREVVTKEGAEAVGMTTVGGEG